MENLQCIEAVPLDVNVEDFMQPFLNFEEGDIKLLLNLGYSMYVEYGFARFEGSFVSASYLIYKELSGFFPGYEEINFYLDLKKDRFNWNKADIVFDIQLYLEDLKNADVLHRVSFRDILDFLKERWNLIIENQNAEAVSADFAYRNL